MTDTPFGADSRLTDNQKSFVRGYQCAIRELDNERASIEDALAVGGGSTLSKIVAEVEHNCLSRMVSQMSFGIERIESDFVAINDTSED